MVKIVERVYEWRKGNMKKTRQEKGITLIALIITIVVLLLLAAVAISSITNDGILQYSTNAAKDYNQAAVNEQQTLNGYINFGSKENDANPPTDINVTEVNGNTVILQAIGGTVESGTVAGYQYSMDGTNWSETIESGKSYTTVALTEGTSWTIYAKTIDEAGDSSTAIEYKIISFTVNSSTYYAKEGMNWYEWCNSAYNTTSYECTALDSNVRSELASSGASYIEYESERIYGNEEVIEGVGYVVAIETPIVPIE